ncbi:sensor histidine kinase [Leucobacter weissii]|uniref:histidine kinase n=1 Tax=Leucobacter weissii TaxID=1983706 RepID=A0A939MMA9_9MICO|nr:sensor histidine kinase [Leucobacter weissii]MBO1902490.1 sensor histidine kinase [Leucobacter weissii]
MMMLSLASGPWNRLRRVTRRPTPARAMPTLGWIAIVVTTIGLFSFSVPALVGFYDMPLVIAFALVSVQCMTLPMAVRYPRAAIAVHMVSVVLIGEAARVGLEDFWPVPVPTLASLMALLVILGLRESWLISVSAWWLNLLGMMVVVALNTNELMSRPDWGMDVLISMAVTLTPLAVSIAIGQRENVREIAATAKRDVQLEQARRATVEERARIARELHDVVAHSMSIVHIQAESARYRVDDLDGARTEFDDIARSARAALGEMRQLLDALHPDEDETYYAPQPTIAEIPALIRSTEKVGVHVDFASNLTPGSLSPVVELTVYRIVQEALSNVMRHAPGAAVRVTLRHRRESLDVRVSNGPPPHPAPAARDEAGGNGLRGMRERVALLHGTIDHAPSPDGGFVVAATLPTTLRKDTP